MSALLCANTDITIILRTAALPTDTTAHSGLAAASSSEPVRGIGQAGVMAIATTAATMAVGATMAADMTMTGIATLGARATTETTGAGIVAADMIGTADTSGGNAAGIGTAGTSGGNAAGMVVTIETAGVDAVTAADTTVADLAAAATEVLTAEVGTLADTDK